MYGRKCYVKSCKTYSSEIWLIKQSWTEMKLQTYCD